VTDVGNRHRGTADGALNIGGRPDYVEIRLGADAGQTPVHTAWMLLNVLSRLEGAVSRPRLHCPEYVRAVPWLSPLIRDGQTLRDALLAGARSIGTPAEGFVPVELTSAPDQAPGIVIGVGFQFSSEATFCAIGNGLYRHFLAQSTQIYPGRPIRRTRFWKRVSERRGSKPGRSRTPGLNRSS
jgi:hypothetical protein